MASLRWLRGADRNAVRKLRAAGVVDTYQLWQAVGPQLKRGLNGLARRAAIPRDSLIQLLAADLAARRGWSISRREAVAATVLAALLLLVAGRLAGGLGLLPGVMNGPSRFIAARDLHAFHILAEEDLRPVVTRDAARDKAARDKLIGRYLLAPVKKGRAIVEGGLSTVHLEAADLAGRRLLTIPVELSTVGPQIQPGLSAQLLLAPLKPGPPGRFEVLVLAVDAQKNASRLTAAIAAADVTEIGAALGNSKAFLHRASAIDASPASTGEP